MRPIVLALSLLLSAVAHAADSLAIAQKLYEAGAPHLALARVARDQPASPGALEWMEWESLRLTLLSQLGRSAELLERTKGMPANLPREFQQKVYGHTAWAHLERGEGAAARGYLARLLWRFPLSSGDHQWARRLVIRSWLVEHRPDEAYRAMLRYQQDFAPLARDVAADFVQGLLSEGYATEAMTWLADLDPNSPAALSLQLKVGLVTPDAAIAQAQAALAGPAATPGYARVVADAAEMSQNLQLRADALEQVLASGGAPADVAMQLWRVYVAHGEAAGNRAQLLRGDDGSWLAMASGVSAANPLEGRAVYAYLVGHGAGADTRELALARLFAVLVADKRETTAVRLLAAAPWGGNTPTIADVSRLAARAGENLPAAETRGLTMTVARFAEAQVRFDVAADYYVQAVLASDMTQPDLAATQALKAAIDSLDRAGFKEDATAFYRRMVALRTPIEKASAKPAAKAAGKAAAKPAQKAAKPKAAKGKRKQ